MKAWAATIVILVLLIPPGQEGAAFAQQIRPHVPVPDEPIRSAIFAECSACHGIDVYAYHAADRNGWAGLLADLHRDYPSLFGNDSNREILLDYLAEDFGPDRAPFPREYVPPVINDFFDDETARVFLNNTCTECHEIRVYNRRGSIEYWRSLVLEMRGNGAQLSDENLERLVEWLARTQGPENT